MAIEANDSAQGQLFNAPFTVAAGPAGTFTKNLSAINAQLLDSKLILEIICAGLDANVQLSQFQGNTDDITTMSPILETVSYTPIVTTLTNGNYVLYSTLRAFFLGLELDYLTATTGTVTVIGRA